VSLEHTGKRVQMLVGLAHEAVYTNYALLMRTGRTSASKHKDASVPGMNLQQVPKEKEFRRLFLADESRLWAAVDFSYIELRTLAATCQALFGHSRLAEVVREHTAAVQAGRGDVPDPHQTTGAGLLGVSVEDFLKLPPAEQKAARQKAKSVNFGYPGGLGYKRFVDYARANYGLDVSEKMAKRFKRQWLATYPEMEEYLADKTVAALSSNLGVPATEVAKQFRRLAWEVRRTVSGEQHNQRVWDSLKRLAARNPCLNAETRRRLALPGGCPDLEKRLLTLRACTLTGRVRAGCKYTDSKNTPFQGLAADGGKEAIWRLMYAGYNVVAFVHDEIIVAVNSDRDVKRIQTLMCEAMESVLGHDIPVACKAACGPCWTK
jgi:DNA polymerase I-like protein with 3'-5' exonuclease and polymerase domains